MQRHVPGDTRVMRAWFGGSRKSCLPRRDPAPSAGGGNLYSKVSIHLSQASIVVCNGVGAATSIQHSMFSHPTHPTAISGCVPAEPVVPAAFEAPEVHGSVGDRDRKFRQVDLLLGSAAEVLERILPGDPLGLRELLSQRMRERAVLLDLDRLLLASFVRVAHRAAARPGGSSLGSWLLQQVDGVVDRALHREREQSLGDALDPFAPGLQEDAWSGEGCGVLGQLARSLDLDPKRLNASRKRFHQLDKGIREAFFSLVLEGCSLDQAAQRGGTPALQLARQARQALDVFCASAKPGTANGVLESQHPRRNLS